ncbi:hypothetical protein OE88DRAFT_1665872 [Heliocybe sulcata]|uniref:Uncharacterized protein n=1 Tax=Heliocybe sulcata TaxID=5364 RepID=A0A5C3MRQ2_9AGAM|nr:hypothetical protein OE88DRAFT_1665872 [Heliocybe sulcata]
MDILPPEVLLQIVDQVCDDSGQTACSLRLVSKYFCAVAGSYRFRSAAAVGTKSVTRLLEALCNAGPEERGSLRHLFISDTLVEGLKTRSYGHTSLELYTEREEMRKAEETRGLEFAGKVKNILALVGSSIRTLMYLAHTPHGQYDLLAALPSANFPRLSHLTLRLVEGRFPSIDSLPLSLSPPMPNLSHLHIQCSWGPSCAIIAELGSMFASNNVTSRLSYIRFSGIGFTLSCQETLASTLNTVSRSSERCLLPMTTKELILDPLYVESRVSEDHRSIESVVFTRRNEVRARTTGSRVKFRMVPPGPVRTAMRSKADWLMVQSGQLGISDDWF